MSETKAQKTASLEKAVALYRSGISPRECELKTGVNYQKVQREANKRGIKKGDLNQLINSIASDKLELESLNETDESLVSKLANDLAADKKMIRALTTNNLAGVSKKLADHNNMTMTDHRSAQELIDKASITLNINNRHAPPVQVQQNTQQVTEVVFTRAKRES